MSEDGDGSAGQATGGARRSGPLAGLMGVLFGGFAALVAFLVLRTYLDGRRAGGPERRTAARAALQGEPTAHPPPPCAGDGAAEPPAGSRCAEILALFGELRPGASIDRWTLLRIGAEQDGAIPVRMADAAGRPFDLQILRRDPEGPRAPAEEGDLAVYLVGVPGGSATPEEHGLGAMTLAAALAESGNAPPDWLRTMRQRAGGTAGTGAR